MLRAATARAQALLVLRWFKDASRLRILAIGAAISTAAAYRYPHEGIDVIADRAPTPPFKGTNLEPDAVSRNAAINALRAGRAGQRPA